MRPWAGPVIDLLLEHVGHVRLCSKLTELLDSRDDWMAVKRKSREWTTIPHLVMQTFTNNQATNLVVFPFVSCLQCRLVHCCTSAD